MSIHSTFKNKNSKKRTVRKRWERIKRLIDEGNKVVSATGLPKEKREVKPDVF